MKLRDILQEELFFTYRGTIRITYKKGLGILEIAELIRGLAGVTTVNPASHQDDIHRAVFEVKMITKKPPREAFIDLRKRALEKLPVILRFEIAMKTITKL